MVKTRCLIVDDNDEIRQELKFACEKHEQIEVVDVAKDGVEAITKIQEFNPDVVVLDIVMPVLDGYGVLEFFKNNKYKNKKNCTVSFNWIKFNVQKLYLNRLFFKVIVSM